MGIIWLLNTILWLYTLVILARVIVDWIPSIDRYHPAVVFLYKITEPVLGPVRQLIGPMQGFDLSPLIVVVVIQLIQRLLL